MRETVETEEEEEEGGEERGRAVRVADGGSRAAVRTAMVSAKSAHAGARS